MKKLVFIFALILTMSFGKEIYATTNTNKKVLIAYGEESTFRSKIVEKVKEKLEKKEYVVEVIKLRKYKTKLEKRYDRILIIDWLHHAGLTSKTKKTIRKTKNTDKYILFITYEGYGTFPRELEKEIVDGMAAASEIKEVDDLTDELVHKIEKGV